MARTREVAGTEEEVLQRREYFTMPTTVRWFGDPEDPNQEISRESEDSVWYAAAVATFRASTSSFSSGSFGLATRRFCSSSGPSRYGAISKSSWRGDSFPVVAFAARFAWHKDSRRVKPSCLRTSRVSAERWAKRSEMRRSTAASVSRRSS
jgi:hypothetical protein